MKNERTDMSRRAQFALAHLWQRGYFDSATFPLSEREKYLSQVATELRPVLAAAGAALSKFTRPDNTVGYVIVPFEIDQRTKVIGLAVPEPIPRYFARELQRLEAER